jgi:hypothetical protein
MARFCFQRPGGGVGTEFGPAAEYWRIVASREGDWFRWCGQPIHVAWNSVRVDAALSKRARQLPLTLGDPLGKSGE